MPRRRRDDEEHRRAAELARRINALTDLVAAESGRPFTYSDVVKALEPQGITLSKARWYYLKDGTHTVSDIPLLEALAKIFGVPASYLITLSSDVPPRVEERLHILRAIRMNQVRAFSMRALDGVSPKTIDAITKAIDEALAEDGLG